MQPADFRMAFLETLQELSDLAGDDPVDGRAAWSVDYLTRRKTWFSFSGTSRAGMLFARGRALDTISGAMIDDEAIMMTFRLLDFTHNQLISAYMGKKRLATQIAGDLSRGLIRAPEFVSVQIDHEVSTCPDTIHRSSTRFIFVGFERMDDADDVGSGKGLAGSRDSISPHWYRNRIRFPEKRGVRLTPKRAA